MNYESWINTLDSLKEGYIDKDALKKMQESEINDNINGMLIIKIEDLIRNRFQKTIDKIINNLSEIFTDINYLDLTLVNFKKEINYITEIVKLKQMPIEKQTELQNLIKNGTEKTYDILTNEAINIDPKGMYALTITNNKIKWSDIL